MRKYASYDSAEVLDIKGSPERSKTASLAKLADFDEYRTEDGFLYARIRAISSRVNKNDDGWPSVELAGSKDIFDHHTASEGFTLQASRDAEYGFSTFLGKPIFVDHHNSNPERARGVIVDAKFHVDDHKTAGHDPYYASDSVDSEHLPPSWVELLLEVDAHSFPRLAAAIIEGSQDPAKGIDGFSMGCDVERSICNICKNSASAPEDFCNHIKLKGYEFDYVNPKTGRKESRKSYENCVTPETPILMADGSYRSIEDVTEGDFVIDHIGERRIVNATYSRKVSEDIFEIHRTGQGFDRPLRVTGDHPLLVVRAESKKAIEKGDLKPTFITAAEVTERDWIVETIPRHVAGLKNVLTPRISRYLRKDIPKSITLDEDFGRWCGWYLAEGSISYNRLSSGERSESSVVFGLHREEVEEREEILRLGTKLFGISGKVDVRNNGTAIAFHNRPLALFMSQLGTSSISKALPHDWLSGPVTFINGVVGAHREGDGHYNPNGERPNEVLHCTSSPHLADQLYDMNIWLGHTPSRRLDKPSIQNKRTVAGTLIAYPAVRQRGPRNRIEGEWNLSKVSRIERVHYKGRVYNLEVADTHTYVANGQAVHNCYGIKFFEISAVFDPADETALTREIRSSVHKEAEDIGGNGRIIQPHEIPGDSIFLNRPEEAGGGGNFLIPCPRCQGVGCPACNDYGEIASDVVYQKGHEGVESPYRMDGPGSGVPIIDSASSGYGPVRQGSMHQADGIAQGVDENGQPYPSGRMLCPRCSGNGCVDCGNRGELYIPGAADEGIVTPNDLGPGNYTGIMQGPHTVEPVENYLGPRHQGAEKDEGKKLPLKDLADLQEEEYLDAAERERKKRKEKNSNVKTADNPLPQSELPHAPQEINTLREEKVCPVCGSSMDEETCDICGYTEPPESFQNPDLEKAQETDLRMDEQGDQQAQPPEGQPPADAPIDNTPRNPSALSHVTRDMEWDVPTPKTAGRINKAERPLAPGAGNKTPSEQVIKDQPRPVTSSVRTASDFIAAAGATRNKQMEHTAEAASGAPAVATPDVNVDTTGVGGVDDASNEAASKADAQITVTDTGGTGVEGVSADSTESVDQGDEHSKNIEVIPTKTFDDGSSDVEHQHDPVTTEPFPTSADGVKASRWVIEGHDDAPFPNDEIEGGGTVKGTQPADPVGKAEDRVGVKDHVTSPANNSGPTKTWNGTDGNGVTQQQSPVTPDSIAHGESQLQDGGIYDREPATSSAHIFTAMKVADLEVELGLASERYARAAELEKETPAKVATLLETLTRVRTAGLQKARKMAGTQKLPVMGRSASTPEPKEESAPEGDDSFLFGA